VREKQHNLIGRFCSLNCDALFNFESRHVEACDGRNAGLGFIESRLNESTSTFCHNGPKEVTTFLRIIRSFSAFDPDKRRCHAIQSSNLLNDVLL
jgi:hypothetical protein